MKCMTLLGLVLTQQCKWITACSLPKYKVYVLYSNIKIVDLVRGIYAWQLLRSVSLKHFNPSLTLIL